MRTKPGIFKRAMWYHESVGYGNDLVKQAPGPWDDKTKAAYVSFIEPLIGR